MASKKLSITNIIFLIILLCVLSAVSGCASQTPRAQAQPQFYPCPSPRCVNLIPEDKINPNIRIENTCPNCGQVFFGKPEGESNKSQGKPYQVPKVFDRGYYSDIEHDNEVEYSDNRDWNISPDGNSGSMKRTVIRKYKRTIKGERGTMVGAGGFGRYDGY